MIRTAICDLLGIEYPIIQGGMAWTSTAELAAAVSEGGGIGIIGSGGMTGEILADNIHRAKQMTAKPFGVNLMLMDAKLEELIEAVLNDPPALVTTGAGSPGKLIPLLKERGTKIIPVIPSVALAQRMERAGADAVIAEGTESGGHVGELTTMTLVPQVVDAVSVPVVAAGGIMDGRGLVAALALGAAGVQMGTRFLCAQETRVHANVKEKVLGAKDRDTVVTGRCTGHPVRVIKNKLTRELEELDIKNQPEELMKLGTGKLRAAMQDGDVEWGSVMCGQGAGLVKKIQPAAEIIEEILAEAQAIIGNFDKLARQVIPTA